MHGLDFCKLVVEMGTWVDLLVLVSALINALGQGFHMFCLIGFLVRNEE